MASLLASGVLDVVGYDGTPLKYHNSFPAIWDQVQLYAHKVAADLAVKMRLRCPHMNGLIIEVQNEVSM
ncbi:hypothetical protein M422DRAFT_23579 [Sphaerobolus stellatus SS14]|nr:hypothetical protein M422DRAFT_23579 [Sphaerobolus stellatus SS14]